MLTVKRSATGALIVLPGAPDERLDQHAADVHRVPIVWLRDYPELQRTLQTAGWELVGTVPWGTTEVDGMTLGGGHQRWARADDGHTIVRH